MVRVRRSGLMDQSSRESMLKGKRVERDSTNGPMELPIKETGWITKSLALDTTSGRMEGDM